LAEPQYQLMRCWQVSKCISWGLNSIIFYHGGVLMCSVNRLRCKVSLLPQIITLLNTFPWNALSNLRSAPGNTLMWKVEQQNCIDIIPYRCKVVYAIPVIFYCNNIITALVPTLPYMQNYAQVKIKPYKYMYGVSFVSSLRCWCICDIAAVYATL